MSNSAVGGNRQTVRAVCVLLATCAFGQAPDGRYSVSGVVRNSVTADPIRNAVVIVTGVPTAVPGETSAPTERQMALTKATLSGTAGEFRFDGLPAGQYQVLARKPDFMPDDDASPSTEFVLPRTAPEEPLQLSLTPFGAIEGTVINQFGEPMEYVLISVLSARISDGAASTTEVGQLRTDNRGHFLLTRVTPGKYYVKAVGRDGGTEVHRGPGLARYAPWESFAAEYWGGAAELATATPVEVAPGSRIRADFRVELQRAYQIHGSLEGDQGYESVTFELLRGNEPGYPQRAVLYGDTGRFEVYDVLPGTYTLRATQEKKRGEATVTVSGGDLAGIRIALMMGTTIHGSTHAVSPGSTRFVAPEGPPPVGGCTVSFQAPRRDSEYGGVARGTEFTIEGVFPGEYRAAVQCQRGYAVSASFGYTDLLSDPMVRISPGPTPPIEVTFNPGGGILRASLAGNIPPGLGFLLVPSFPTFSGPILRSPREGFSTTARPLDRVVFSGLPPGEYTVYALSNSDEAAFREPDFLQSLSGGSTVQISDGKTTEVTIERVSR